MQNYYRDDDDDDGMMIIEMMMVIMMIEWYGNDDNTALRYSESHNSASDSGNGDNIWSNINYIKTHSFNLGLCNDRILKTENIINQSIFKQEFRKSIIVNLENI